MLVEAVRYGASPLGAAEACAPDPAADPRAGHHVAAVPLDLPTGRPAAAVPPDLLPGDAPLSPAKARAQPGRYSRPAGHPSRPAQPGSQPGFQSRLPQA